MEVGEFGRREGNVGVGRHDWSPHASEVCTVCVDASNMCGRTFGSERIEWSVGSESRRREVAKLTKAQN